MAKKNQDENSQIKVAMEDLKIASNVFGSNPSLHVAVREANIALANSTTIRIAEGITRQFNNIFSGNELITKSFMNAFNFQAELLRTTQNFFLTETINSFRNYLVHNDYFSAIETISKLLKSPVIEAPNIALFKLNKSLLELAELEFPTGLRTSIDRLHKRTALDLSTSESVSYNCGEATFFIEANPQDSCNATEINVIYSIARLFDELTDEELFSFLRHLSTFYSLALSHKVGQKILRIVGNIENTISFDSEYFYHASSPSVK